MTINYREWQSCNHEDEPRDQQRDLFGPYWAQVGPDTRQDPDGWSFSIIDFDLDNEDVHGGFTATEDEAKAAVQAWYDGWST
jgi:hypothetical protein